MTLRIVQTEADDELVGYLESHVIDRAVVLRLARFLEQGGYAKRSRSPARKDVVNVKQRKSCVHNIFNNNDIFAANGTFQVFLNVYRTRRRCRVAITSHRHQLYSDR